MRPDLVFIKLLSTTCIVVLQTRPIRTLDIFDIVFRLAVFRVRVLNSFMVAIPCALEN